MKLGKGSFLAIVETGFFVLGAVFFAMVLIIPTNPLWALIAGIFCGLAGAITWSSSLFVRMGQKVKTRVRRKTVNATDVAKQILEDDDELEDGYELHRTTSYDQDDIGLPDAE